MRLRTLIVDDEPLARERIRALLEQERDVEVVGECSNGPDALAAIKAHRPDLVFLDIQMPGLDGLGVVEQVPAGSMPVVIFVTAYDRYAIRAFEVHAQDYLLKPFDRERFGRALTRARVQVIRNRSGDLNQRLLAVLEGLKGGSKYVERMVIKSSGRVFFLRVDEVDWVEASANYVRLHVGRDSHLLRETMNALEAKLDPARFIRIHRSTIVNVDRVKELQPLFHGEYAVILRDGTELSSSRGYRDRLQGLFSR